MLVLELCPGVKLWSSCVMRVKNGYLDSWNILTGHACREFEILQTQSFRSRPGVNLSPRDFVLTPMAGRKELYASTKLAIVKLSQNGEKSSQIARILDLNERT